MKWLPIIFLPFMVGCIESPSESNDGEISGPVCTAVYVFGLSIKVLDQISKQPMTCNSTITVEDGNYQEIYEYSHEQDCDDDEPMRMAGERAGIYDIRIEREGYDTGYLFDISVTENECHVIPQELVVELVPNT